MKRGIKELTLKLFAVLFSTVPPIIATLSYFPLWCRSGAVTVISGLTLLLLLFSISPVIKLLRRYFASPTSRGLWFFTFVVFFALSKIADELVVISFVGYLGNLISSLLWRFSGRVKIEGQV